MQEAWGDFQENYSGECPFQYEARWPSHQNCFYTQTEAKQFLFWLPALGI